MAMTLLRCAKCARATSTRNLYGIGPCCMEAAPDEEHPRHITSTAFDDDDRAIREQLQDAIDDR